ncbi:MAG TPA: family 10 glycosylhydrolase [Gemmatimonadaceae bacterium]|nr:family 10 glycosylhydrolase [Gemmatimonadaceae bacterium]
MSRQLQAARRRAVVLASLALAGCAAPAATPSPPSTVVTATVVETTTVRVSDTTVALGTVDSAAPMAPAFDPPRPAREFRGAWVSPVWGSGMKDWPSRVGMTADEQRRELRTLLDHARDLGLNAIMLHVRTHGDALYPSAHAPWSVYLSGSSGVPPSPSYDPLAFAIEEAHARGLQLHAWFNPFRAAIAGLADSPAPTHVRRAHPEWIKRYGTQTWIDPGFPEARRAVLDAVREVVRRYDVDGVHIDDYFYPYRERAPIPIRKGGRRAPAGDLPFPDEDTWRRYGAPRGFTDRAAWRRANVDELVQALYREVKQEKPWVLVGISPFGVWRPGYPAGLTGLDAYGEIYADSRKWLLQGWLDYVAPQLYWELAGEQARFRRLDAWWRTQNPHDRHIWPGLHTARVVGESSRWSLAEIPRQVEWLRAQREGSAESNGHVHFRLASIRSGPGGLFDPLRRVYASPALVPASPWLGASPPPRPARAQVSRGVVLVTPGDTTPVRWWLLRGRDASGRWSMELHPGADRAIRTALAEPGRYPTLTVAAVGRTELESPPVAAR